MMDAIKGALIAYGVGAAVTKVAGVVLHVKAVPLLMAATGKVVAGVGTLHSAGSLTAVTQAAACSMMTTPVVLGGGAVALGAWGAYALISRKV